MNSNDVVFYRVDDTLDRNWIESFFANITRCVYSRYLRKEMLWNRMTGGRVLMVRLDSGSWIHHQERWMLRFIRL